MSSKTLNKRITNKRITKKRIIKKISVKNTTRQKQKQMRNYLGGGKYTDDENFKNAYTEVNNVSAPTDALYWLEEAHKEHPDETDIKKLIKKLTKSGKLLTEAQERIEELYDE